MSISLVTGTPGAGKTLFMIKKLIEELLHDDRTIVHNITGLQLDHPNLVYSMPYGDIPHHWQQFPDGCVFIFDEVQREWPIRNPSAPVPPYISALEVHRHRGFDFWLITQSPMFIDVHVRKLCDRHFHLYRPFGLSRSTLFEWQSVNPDPNPKGTRANSNTSNFSFPSKYFTAYKSSTIHTVKRRIPWRLVIIASVMFSVVAVVGVLGYQRIMHHLAPNANMAAINAEIEAADISNAAPPLLCFRIVQYGTGFVRVRRSDRLDMVSDNDVQNSYTIVISAFPHLLCEVPTI
jgi:zona occludens toxin